MWWTELRGLIAVGLAVAAIAFAWTRIEARSVDPPQASATTTTSTTTTALPPSTTLSSDDANAQLCERARTFAAEVAFTDVTSGDGALAPGALAFWTEIELLTSDGARAEVAAVVNYYTDYIEAAEPFGYDYSRVIVEGDKEKLEQLLTRPAPGLESARALIGFCGVEVPDQPSMSEKEFEDLEDRLLDDD